MTTPEPDPQVPKLTPPRAGTRAAAKAEAAWEAEWRNLHQEMATELDHMLTDMRAADQHQRPPSQRIRTLSIYFEKSPEKQRLRLLVAALSRLVEEPPTPPPSPPLPLWQRVRHAMRSLR